VSRRVALGYRTRTDLANSLQFTVRTLADIEHGVRKASPGTYAMLETSSAGHPEASTSSSEADSPNELVVNIRRPQPPNPLARASTEELLLELRRRIPALIRLEAQG
jgi:hypothetical protein